MPANPYDAARALMAALDAGPGTAAITSLANAYARLAAELDANVAEFIRSIQGHELAPSDLLRLHRYQQLLQQIAGLTHRYYVLAEAVISDGQGQAIAQGVADSQRLVQMALPLPEASFAEVGIQFNRVDEKAFAAMVGFTSNGTKLRDVLDAYAKSSAEAMADKLRTGIGLGRNPKAVAKEIMHTASNVTFGWSQQMTRSAMLNAYRTASVGTWAANSVQNGGVVTGMRRYCSRSLRTCICCIELDGTVTPVDAGEIRSHRSCRCTWVPVLVTDTAPPIAPAKEWYNTLTSEQQGQIIGNGKIHRALTEGRVSASDLVTTYDDPVWGPAYYPANSYEELVRQGKVREVA